MTCFIVLLILGVVAYLIFKGKKDRPELLGASKRSMGSGPIEPHPFVSPYAKCATCGASGDKMKGEWDGMRTVKWSCGYCSAPAGLQQLKDEELPASARRRLGLDQDPSNFQGGPGYQGGGGGGNLLTGVLLGTMLSGGGHHHHHDDNSSNSDSDWGDSSSDSSSDSGGDWGDSGGGDSGGDW
jgi:hypothetical protein